MFRSLSIQEFYRRFQSDEDCKEYLFSIKWKNGFKCRRCGNPTSGKGRTRYHLRCRCCGYDESLTANTIFHKLKIPLLKAFGIVYELSTSKKGRSSNNLWKEFRVNPKTAYSFRRRAQKAIELSFRDLSCQEKTSYISVDGITLNHRAHGLSGFQRFWLHLEFFNSGNGNERRKIRPVVLVPEVNSFSPSGLVGGKFVDENKRILLWNFKIWLTGVLHHCSVGHLEGYLLEYFFRYNHRNEEDMIWHTMIVLCIAKSPV